MRQISDPSMTNTDVPEVIRHPLPSFSDARFRELFASFAHAPWAMLLDSAGDDHPDARFDIIVASPIATVEYQQGKVRITHQQTGNVTHHKGDPLVHVRDLQDQLIGQHGPIDPDNTLPFIAGALGYIGYDIGREYESLPDCAEYDYHSPELAMGIYSWSVIRERASGNTWLCYLNTYPHPDIEDLMARNIRALSTFRLTSPWQANLCQQAYFERIDKIHEYLRAGDCYQVNLAQRFSAGFDGDPWHAYLQLTAVNQAPFSAFIRLPESCILSISPERFLSVNGGVVQTKPIKGTRPRQENSLRDAEQREALEGSVKDKAENLMIVDLLRNDLSKNCTPGSIRVPALFSVESFAAVHHLVSTVTGTLADDKDPMDLLRGAFPGGSITGAPKVRAMEIIDELEPHRRHIYCGSIGYIGLQGDMDTNICIRTLLCENDRIYCWAGGGIVLDSDAASEYQETFDKVSRILPVLAQG